MSYTIKNLRQVDDMADGLELLVFGPHHENDGELLDEDPWAGS